MHMVMLVIDDMDRLDEVLDAWLEVGVAGATIIESTGLHRLRFKSLGARYSFGLPRASDRVEQGHYTVFVAVKDVGQARQCLAAAESVLGDLDDPHTGIFAAWPLTVSKGLLSAMGEYEGLGGA